MDVSNRNGSRTRPAPRKADGHTTAPDGAASAELGPASAELLRALRAYKRGDFSVRMSLEHAGVTGEIAHALNEVIALSERVTREVGRLGEVVGREGRLGHRASLDDLSGDWRACVESLNRLVGDMAQPTAEVRRVITAMASGDLTQRMPLEIDGQPFRGEFLAKATVVNALVDQLSSFTSEVTRVAREVGIDGKLGGQAEVKGSAGTWKDLTDSVNLMAGNLTAQVRNIAEVTTAVAKGDLSKKITVDVKGEIQQLKHTINTMVDQLRAFASEVTRVAREVGTDGRLGGQAQVEGVAGTWKDLTDSVNSMASNLTAQVRNIAEVTTAVAKGDLSKKITVDVKGEIEQLKSTINTMVEQLRAFASEVTRVAREVGTEGRLGGQAQVEGVAGTWKDLTDSVNSMASNLTAQVRNIAEVTTAVAKGDLSKQIAVDVKGEMQQLKATINTMVDQLRAFASEVTRVAREVGSEGKLGGQAQVSGVAGTWKDLTDNVNSMASNLTGQVRNIADVTTAVARGDLSKKITVDVKGEILELKSTINTMVEQLRGFASEVTRVAREVGTDGRLGGQAQVEGVAGTWKDLTDSVNSMASNLTGQVRNIAEVTTAVARGDLSKQITVDVKGEILELKNTINTMVDRLNAFASEVTRVAREVGTEGKLGGQAQVPGVAGTWKDLTDNVNSMASNLTAQVRNIADVTTAVARGDLSRQITVDVKGEILELKVTINTMVDQLNAFASEVTRVAREVGTEGKLGGQAIVRGVAGTWKDLTDSVNFMASNLTDQVRGIAKVVTAVANGDLTRKLALEARGEIAALAETINSMTDTLATFSEQATTVAREVGVEGRLGGQAKVPGAAGTWRHLVDNVNQLAGNLTTQVRAISEVATAVTKGDLTRSIAVEASGEVRTLKDNINEMIRALRETTQKTTEQDWLKTNLARFTRMLQGQRDLVTVAQQVLSELAPLVSAQHGVFYVAGKEADGEVELKLLASYAYRSRKHVSNRFALGEGLVGQCAFEKQKILLASVPPDYIQISSGLGEAPPLEILVLPVLFEDQVNAVIELASFGHFSEIHQVFLDQLTESIGIVVNTISASMQTESVLKQSQSLTTELQTQQEELRQTNERLENQAASLRQSEERLREQQEELRRTNEQLEEKAKLLEVKNREVGFAKTELEEKAEQLALTSKYKSEFLANMSHELRTPLNSLLILSRMLAENPEGNLTGKQTEFASTIHTSGTDLLGLINDILDLSKIESGTMTADPSEVVLAELRDYVEQNFRHVAEERGLAFAIELAPGAPRAIYTDAKRLQQVLKNLLSNAIKFTEHGRVAFEIAPAPGGWSRDGHALSSADQVIAFRVVDTGIGISADKQKIIFEAFQQADGTTSRKYGGTGLGLSISREIARLLGGEICVESATGEGSVFTLFLPRVYGAPEAPPLPLREGRARPVTHEPESAPSSWAAIDDRDHAAPGDRVLVVVEEDDAVARALVDAARTAGWKAVVVPHGEAGLAFAQRLTPTAIALDLRLPDLDGWVALDLLKVDRAVRHVPVLVMGAGEPAERRRALTAGAFAYLDRAEVPGAAGAALAALRARAEAGPGRLLIAAADGDALAAAIGVGDIAVDRATTGAAALERLAGGGVDCVLVDAELLDMTGVELIAAIGRTDALAELPIVLHLAAPPGDNDDGELRRLGEAAVLRIARTLEEVLDHTAMFLRRALATMPEAPRQALEALHRGASLDGVTVLVVDDDIRNIFAVASALERQRATVLYAESGRDGLAILDEHADVDVVLMDIMMPEMDGYEVIRRIRAQPRFDDLPIIALTAKAMKADREKCTQAGASDYIAKPVDMARLLSMIRVRRRA